MNHSFDRRTDGQTDIPTMAIAAFCIASRGKYSRRNSRPGIQRLFKQSACAICYDINVVAQKRAVHEQCV